MDELLVAIVVCVVALILRAWQLEAALARPYLVATVLASFRSLKLDRSRLLLLLLER